jgi:outer membrane protein assembly factor BamE (lipoprotein component of BamABCDE complex)
MFFNQNSLPTPVKLSPVSVFILAALFFVGCASTGNNFDENKLSEIKKGETTEAQLTAMFGEPQNRSVNSDGQVIVTWMYAEATVKGESFIPYAGAFMGGSRSKMKSLTVTLREGTVTGFTYSGGGNETRNVTQDTPKN